MDVVHGENSLRKLPNLQIVASQTGHVLDNHGGDFSRLHQSHHLLESISVHGDTGNTIVHENANILEFVPPGVIQKKGLLVGNGVALSLQLVTPGKAYICLYILRFSES